MFAELTQAQRRILQLLSAEPTEHPHAAAFVRRAGITGRGVSVALERLEDLELVLHRGERWQVPNPFMRHWLPDPQR